MVKGLVKYRGGYKYQLAVDYTLNVGVYPVNDVKTDFIELTSHGLLTIRAGYAWDGASGPTVDTKSSMRGSLVHDALYQLMRMNLLEHSWRGKADDVLFALCLEDGMFRWRAWLWRKMVGEFADGASKHENDNPILTAP
jgi:hypothetical protein